MPIFTIPGIRYIFPKEVIRQKYFGGVDQFRVDFDLTGDEYFDTCYDDELYSVWMNFEDAQRHHYITLLQLRNLHYDEEAKRSDDFAIYFVNYDVSRLVWEVDWLVLYKWYFRHANCVLDDAHKAMMFNHMDSIEVGNTVISNKSFIKPIRKRDLDYSLSPAKIRHLDPDEYKEIDVGGKIWMDRNLNVDRFRNGDLIPHAASDEAWAKAVENKEPAWCYPLNFPKATKQYGKLYNGYAVTDPRGLAPEGWRIPNDTDYLNLISLYGSTSGGSLKSIEFWEKGHLHTNESGFSGLPAGFRCDDGSFAFFSDSGYYWSAAEGFPDTADALVMSAHDRIDMLKIELSIGLSVRCVKE
ncbi:MAG: hypothetical protein EA412_00765 [Chitinophagaceae bacterium]|nr:MAG: hypothetical protein EA412_00765 [Chitinophagaceae bacterium]